MEIRFCKHAGNTHGIEIRQRRQGPDIRRRPQETGPTLPHDLAHAAVEAALGLRRGFWQAVDGGATFEGFEPLVPGRHARSGLKALRRVAEAEMEAEHKVSWAHRAWSGQRVAGKGLGAPPLSDAERRTACAALDDAYRRWSEVAEGGCLVWHWPPRDWAGA